MTLSKKRKKDDDPETDVVKLLPQEYKSYNWQLDGAPKPMKDVNIITRQRLRCAEHR